MLDKFFAKKASQVSFKVCEKEYDSPELTAFFQWLDNQGWSSREKSHYVVGSQEITTYEITKKRMIAHLRLETYEGVILSTAAENEHLFSEIKILTREEHENNCQS